MDTVNYLRNHLPTRSPRGEVIPKECWTGRKQDLVHIRVFGSVAHVGIAKGGMIKSDTRKTWKGILIGYSPDISKHYRVWAPKVQRVFIVDNPTIDESEQGAKLLQDWLVTTIPTSLPAKRKANAGEPKPRGRPRKNPILVPISKRDEISELYEDPVRIAESTTTNAPETPTWYPTRAPIPSVTLYHPTYTIEQAMSSTEISSKVYEPTTYDEAVSDSVHGRNEEKLLKGSAI